MGIYFPPVEYTTLPLNTTHSFTSGLASFSYRQVTPMYTEQSFFGYSGLPVHGQFELVTEASPTFYETHTVSPFDKFEDAMQPGVQPQINKVYKMQDEGGSFHLYLCAGMLEDGHSFTPVDSKMEKFHLDAANGDEVAQATLSLLDEAGSSEKAAAENAEVRRATMHKRGKEVWPIAEWNNWDSHRDDFLRRERGEPEQTGRLENLDAETNSDYEHAGTPVKGSSIFDSADE